MSYPCPRCNCDDGYPICAGDAACERTDGAKVKRSPSPPAEPQHIRDFWQAAAKAGEALAASGGDGREFCDALDRLTTAILHPEEVSRQQPTLYGWVVWWLGGDGKRRPVFHAGAERPSYGAQLDAMVPVTPVYTLTPKT